MGIKVIQDAGQDLGDRILESRQPFATRLVHTDEFQSLTHIVFGDRSIGVLGHLNTLHLHCLMGYHTGYRPPLYKV